MNNLYEKYQKEVLPVLVKEFDVDNVLAAPRLVKIVVNQGLKDAAKDENLLKKSEADLAMITGQKPVIRRAKKSIAGFKLVKGSPIGLSVTLRSERMYNFLGKIINVVLPRLRDFRGVPVKSFDDKGNYTLGIFDQIVFPEIEFVKTEKPRGLEVTLVTTAKNKEESRRLLELLGIPFEK